MHNNIVLNTILLHTLLCMFLSFFFFFIPYSLYTMSFFVLCIFCLLLCLFLFVLTTHYILVVVSCVFRRVYCVCISTMSIPFPLSLYVASNTFILCIACQLSLTAQLCMLMSMLPHCHSLLLFVTVVCGIDWLYISGLHGLLSMLCTCTRFFRRLLLL